MDTALTVLVWVLAVVIGAPLLLMLVAFIASIIIAVVDGPKHPLASVRNLR